MDNWLRYYIQPNGGPTYRGEETAVQSRMLTLFALYVVTPHIHLRCLFSLCGSCRDNTTHHALRTTHHASHTAHHAPRTTHGPAD